MDLKNFIINSRTGERVALSPAEAAARAEFAESSRTREAQYKQIDADIKKHAVVDPTGQAGSRRKQILFVEEAGDWSWKPARDTALGAHMVTFLGVPKSSAELYRGRGSA